MGLIILILFSPYVYMGMAVGIPAGVVLALLPRTMQWLAFAGLVVLFLVAVSSSDINRHTFSNGEMGEMLIPALFATAAFVAAGTMIVMIPVRFILGKIIARIREVTSVRTQVSIATGIVALLTVTVGVEAYSYMQEQDRIAQAEVARQAQLEADFVRMAGEWYGFERLSADGYYREVEQKVFVDIKADGAAKIYWHPGVPREEAFGDDLIIKGATVVTADVVGLETERPGYRYAPTDMVLTRVGTRGTAWPGTFLEHPLLEAVADDQAGRKAELLELIRTTARNDIERAATNVQGMLAGAGEYHGRIEYDYLAELDDVIDDRGVVGVFRIKGADNAYAAFAYGSMFYDRNGPGHVPCRLLYGLVYVDRATGWQRVPYVEPNKVCDYSSDLGPERAPVAREVGADMTEDVAVEEAMPDLDEAFRNGLNWMLEAAIEQADRVDGDT